MQQDRLDSNFIYQTFIRKIPFFNIDSYESLSPWTKSITRFFLSWGQELEYDVRCKQMFGGIGEHLLLDVVWINNKENQGTIELAVEHENRDTARA